MKKNESEFIAAHAKESLNFHLTMIIAYLISFVLIIVLVGVLLLIALGIFTTIWVIVATIRASEGRLYKYPFTIQFVK